MISSELPREWSTEVANHEVVQSGDSRADARRNMLVFALSDIRSASPEPDDLDRFLMEVFHAFCMKAALLPSAGWFYAWFDEMSGTLRCSACSVGSAAELPFSCRIEIVDAPNEITRAALSSNYIFGIPATELEQAETGHEPENPVEYVLRVFAKPLIRAAR